MDRAARMSRVKLCAQRVETHISISQTRCDPRGCFKLMSVRDFSHKRSYHCDHKQWSLASTRKCHCSIAQDVYCVMQETIMPESMLPTTSRG